MQMRTKISLIVVSLFLLFTGCTKEVEEYNQPAVYWYGKIIESVANGNLEKADNYYSSLQSEHAASPLLPEATMILGVAHMHEQEYLLSDHFFTQYIKQYANNNEKEFSEFMKIKAKYMSLPLPRRDQVLINEALVAAQKFKVHYPHSMYYPIVDSMATNLYMARALLNEAIASLYERIDKPKAAKYYRAIEPEPWINWDEVHRANIPWYREWFVGNGTSSWYDFMIPDTKNVVSRNSVQDDNTTQN